MRIKMRDGQTDRGAKKRMAVYQALIGPFLCLSLCLALAGCGGRGGQEGKEVSTDAVTAASKEAESAETTETIETTETTVTTETIDSSAGTEAAKESSPKDAATGATGAMESALQAIIRAIAEDGYRYNSGDPHFIWRALYYAALEENQAKEDASLDKVGETFPAQIRVEEQTLLGYLHAFFEDVEALPDIDEATGAYVSREGSEIVFVTDDQVQSKLEIGTPEELGDGSLRIKGDYLDASGEKKSGWIFIVRPQEEGFPYVVQYLENESFMCSDIYEAMQSMTAGETAP